MKKLNYLFTMLFALTLMVGCDTDPDNNVPAKDEAGLIISVKNSGGSLLGSPEAGVPIEEADVLFSEIGLYFEINKVLGSLDNVSKFEIVKFHNGDANQGVEGTPVAETTTLPFSFNYTTIDDFVAGTGVAANELRIGDTFTFRVKIYQNDGDVYFYNRSMGSVTLTINCAYDLTGTYTMTNSVCTNPQTVAISKNPDGTWYLETADGGLLQFCSANTTLQNDGSISVGCGGVVNQVGDGPTFCGSNGIGCITGGSWDQDTGILTLEHSDDFFSWSGGTYTSTYTRN
ncbi:MAG TPA: hypothetical protein VKY41_09600 [Xanthomarina sp.]|nr:hypothetical protein [Xanthomarina sp.]